jgi:outer membrane protein assembly factor BamB
MLKNTHRVALATLFLAGTASAWAVDWPSFRGPGGLGVSAEKGLPEKWDAKDGVIWKTDLPGGGASSPIIVGDRIFLTCFTDPNNKMARHLICVDRRSGKIQWDKAVAGKANEDRYGGQLTSHGFSSSTPVSDGEHVYVFYGKSGVLGYDLAGNEMWHVDLGDGSAPNGWGSGASPIVYKDKVIVNAAAEGDIFVALDKLTGKEVWRAKADNARGSWSSPIIVDIPGGGQDLVIGVPYEVWGLNPDNGKLRWYATALDAAQMMCTSLVAHDGIVYAVGGRQGGAVAVKAGGKGDVTNTHVLWKAEIGSYVTSPVYVDGHLYWVSDRGIAVCLDAKTGKKVYENRLDGARNLYASVVAADGKLYAVSRTSGTFVLPAKPEYSVLSKNDLGDDSDFNASPAISDGQIFIRSNKALYCLGQKKQVALIGVKY